MDTLIFSLNAVLPILILIGFGYWLKRIGFLDEHFLQIGNKFVFRIALPTLLFYTIYNIEDLSDIWSSFPVIIYAVIGVLLLYLIGLILALLFIKDNRRKGTVIQATFRANFAIIGIPLAEAMGGQSAVAIVALISAIVVPLMNILAVLALTMFVKDENDTRHPLIATTVKIVTNPLIIAIFLGLAALGIRSLIPLDSVTGEHVFSIKNDLEFLYTAIKWMAQIASPIALLVLGGTFEFFVIKSLAKQIALGTVARVIIAPAVTLLLAVWLSRHTQYFEFTATEYPALIALFASPTAVSGAIMAKEMNNDEALAVQYVVWTTSLSIISIFIIVFLFKMMNLI